VRVLLGEPEKHKGESGMKQPLNKSGHCANILKCMFLGWKLTPEIAAKNMYPHCHCLSQRIGDLIRRGHQIQKTKADMGYMIYWQYPVDSKRSMEMEGLINKD
jgi:hypothetical protein